MKSAKFFQIYDSLADLEAHVAAHPELYGKVTVTQFLHTNLPRESAFQAEILRALRRWRADGWIDPQALIWKESAGVYARSGLPDVMAIIDGRFLGVEVKRPYIGELTRLQTRTLNQIAAAKGIAGVARFPADVQVLLQQNGLWLGPEEDDD